MRRTGWVHRKSAANILSSARGTACNVWPASRALRRFWHEDAGQSTLIITFLFSILLFGFVALGIDVGFIFHEQRMAQAAADAAAVAAAEAINTGNGNYEQTAADTMAKLNWGELDVTTNHVKLNSPPSVGNYSSGSNANNYVEAIVSQPIRTTFLGFLNPAAALMRVSARAVAGGGSTAPTCICLMNATGNDLAMSNNAKLNAQNCGVVDDSSTSGAVSITGSASLCALSLGTISTTWPAPSGGGSICSSTKVVEGLKNGCSANIKAPTLPSGITCYDDPTTAGYGQSTGYSGKYTLPFGDETTTNGVLCLNSLNAAGAAAVTFSPGITYYIKGNFTTGGGETISGSNVSLYVGGNLSFANGITVNLTAPYESDGATPGTLFYVNGTSVDMEGGSSSLLRGLLYAPNASVTLANGTSTTFTMDVYAQTLNMAGGAVLNSYADKNLGSLSLGGSQLVE